MRSSRFSPRSFSSLVRYGLMLALLGWLGGTPVTAHAAPVGASGEVSTGSGAQGTGTGPGYAWPELVVGGNAISALLPLQVGLVSYLPKARIGFQYDRQIRRGHWFQVGTALLFDRGSYENFRMDSCGLDAFEGLCGKGGVAGVDLYAGYTYKFFIQKYPFLVPVVRGNIGWSYWALPKLGGGDGNRLQTRTQSWTLNLRPGGGFRAFLLPDLAIGGDVNIPIGFLVHTDIPDGGDKNRRGGFLLGLELLPLVVEYRF